MPLLNKAGSTKPAQSIGLLHNMLDVRKATVEVQKHLRLVLLLQRFLGFFRSQSGLVRLPITELAQRNLRWRISSSQRRLSMRCRRSNIGSNDTR